MYTNKSHETHVCSWSDRLWRLNRFLIFASHETDTDAGTGSMQRPCKWNRQYVFICKHQTVCMFACSWGVMRCVHCGVGVSMFFFFFVFVICGCSFINAFRVVSRSRLLILSQCINIIAGLILITKCNYLNQIIFGAQSE